MRHTIHAPEGEPAYTFVIISTPEAVHVQRFRPDGQLSTHMIIPRAVALSVGMTIMEDADHA